MPLRVAVAGATGYLGQHVVVALHRAGYLVRALARDPARLGPARDACDEVFAAEATRAETLAGFCDGCDAVYAGLGVRSARRRPSVWDVDFAANRNVLEEARRAGVRHFVFAAAIQADWLRTFGVEPAEARERVVDAVRASGLSHTILRGSFYFSDMEKLFAMTRRGTGWVVGDGGTRLNPVHGADLADEVVAAIRGERPAELVRGGPETFTFREILELAFEVRGRRGRIRSISPKLIGAARHLVRPFNPTLAGFLHAVSAGVALDLVGPACGRHRLRELFESLLAAEGSAKTNAAPT